MSMHSKNSLSRWTLAAATLAVLIPLAGCREDMQNEPKMIPQRESKFFADGRSVRPQVEGTVARGGLNADSYFYSGLVNNQEQDAMPFPATMTVLKRGQERFDIYCTPCHSRVGNGRGVIVERGYKPAGNLAEPRILQEPLGHYFAVISHGYGAMPDYASQIDTQDRWAIAAYIRALQLSQSATLQEVPAGINIQTLAEVSEQMGYAPNFPDGWTLPALTNVPSAGDMFPAGSPSTPTKPTEPEATHRGGQQSRAKVTKK
jgi:mono/diheme cytochrome c family protein